MHFFFPSFRGVCASFTLICCCLTSTVYGAASVVLNMKQQSEHDCIISLAPLKKSQTHHFYLQHPRRFVVDIKQPWSKIKPGLSTFCGTSLRIARHAQFMRLVVDLGTMHQMVPHFIQARHTLSLRVTSKHHQTKHATVIVLDAGHGGHDPGATAHGVKEKDIVLAIAKQVQKSLLAYQNVKVIMTRNHDRYIGLRQRLAIARHHHADLFVAIHADAHYNRGAHGLSVFTLSDRGATSEAARWLAHKENISELMGGASLVQQSSSVKSVIIAMQQQSTIDQGIKIGQAILSSMPHEIQLHHHHVEQAAFVVLKSPDIPSLLVETGFISNFAERHRMTQPPYQRQLAKGMALGIARVLHLWMKPKHPLIKQHPKSHENTHKHVAKHLHAHLHLHTAKKNKNQHHALKHIKKHSTSHPRLPQHKKRHATS